MVLTACGGDDGGDGSPPPDQGETPATAEALSLNTTVRGSLASSTDVDFFRIEVPAPGVFSVNTTGDADTMGAILDSVETVFEFNDDYYWDILGEAGNLNFALLNIDLAAGTYYVRVTGFGSGAPLGNYSLVNTTTPN